LAASLCSAPLCRTQHHQQPEDPEGHVEDRQGLALDAGVEALPDRGYVDLTRERLVE
jgi:hypothetical protein